MVMLENIVIPKTTGKSHRYNLLMSHIRKLIYGEENLIASLANVAAILHYGMRFSWTGFYFANGEELVLGPFQGVAARMHIPKGEGVCGVAYAKECTIVVDDVEQFSGYIPCGEHDRSEIVLPAFHQGDVALVLNINSDKLKNFTEVDQKHLQQVMHLIEEVL